PVVACNSDRGVNQNPAAKPDSSPQAQSSESAPTPEGGFAVNVLSRDARVATLHLLVEGNSLRSVTRLTGTHRTTVMNLMTHAGRALRDFLSARMRNLKLKHVQVDEIWTFCLKKQARLTPEEKDDDTIGDQFLYVALDQLTKLVPCFALGKRTQPVTEAFML